MKLHLYALTLFFVYPVLVFSQVTVATEITEKPETAPAVNVHANCLKHFSRSFKNSVHAIWSTNDKGYSVRFKENELSYDVRYNHHGRWMCTIRNIPFQLLDKKIAKFVLNEFKHYNIFFAQEVSVPLGSVYLIKIEKGNEWKCIKVKKWETEVMEEYVKG
ncbi:MAG TPA: hypothetical protein VM101_04380 [Flavitalea sp.]|nr:hypothetical protein [Flavitalea sp.]